GFARRFAAWASHFSLLVQRKVTKRKHARSANHFLFKVPARARRARRSDNSRLLRKLRQSSLYSACGCAARRPPTGPEKIRHVPWKPARKQDFVDAAERTFRRRSGG